MKRKTVFKSAVLIIGVIVIPLLYSYFYLGAFWDPYNTLKSVPVAVVNEDSGAVINGKSRNLGKEAADELVKDGSLKFTETDSADAINGAKGTKYYAVITFPDNFSKNISTAETTNKQTAQIYFEANKKRNYIASQIMKNVVTKVEESARGSVSKEITSQLSAKLNDVPVQMDTLNDGLKTLSDGSVTLYNGASKAADGQVKLSNGINDLHSGINSLYTGSSTVTSGLGTLSDKLSLTSSGVQQFSDKSQQLNALGSGLTDLSNGTSTLSSGLNLLFAQFSNTQSGNTTLKDNIDALNTGAKQVSDGASPLASGAKQVSDGTAALKEQFSSGTSSNPTLSDQISQLNSGTQSYVGTSNIVMKSIRGNSPVYDGIKTSLITALTSSAPNKTDITSLTTTLVLVTDTNNATQLATTIGILGQEGVSVNQAYIATQQAAYDNGGTALTSGTNALEAQTKTTTNGTATLYDSINALNSGAQSVTSGAQALASGASQVTSGTAALDKQMSSGGSGTQTLYDSVSALNSGAAQIASGTNKASSGTSKFGEIQDGFGSLISALNQLQSGSAKLSNGSQQLTNGLSTALNGSTQLQSGSSQLVSANNQIKDGSKKLSDGIGTAKTGVSDSITKANNELPALKGLDSYTKEPVSVKEENLNPIPNYGTAFAPYFMSLSLWVGALLLFFGIYLDADERIKVLSRHSSNKFIRVGAFALIGIAQAVVLALIVHFVLGLAIDNVPAFYLSCMLISLVFISIVEFLIINLKDVGKFLSIAILVLNLTSCGGTFPMETVPKFFNVLYPFMPMTYSVNLLKEVTSNFNTANAWQNAGVLILIFVAFTALTMVFSVTRKAKVLIKEKLQTEN